MEFITLRASSSLRFHSDCGAGSAEFVVTECLISTFYRIHRLVGWWHVIMVKLTPTIATYSSTRFLSPQPSKASPPIVPIKKRLLLAHGFFLLTGGMPERRRTSQKFINSQLSSS